MSVSRMKTIAIAALLLLNVFFASLIIIDTAADASDERQLIESVSALLDLNGITLDPDVIKAGEAIRAMRTARVPGAEELIARAVLGQTTMIDQGGGIYLYDNAVRGTAEFYSAGDFEIRLNDGVVTSEDGKLRTVEKLLVDMGIETMDDTIVAIGSENEFITVVGAYRGVSIFNCTIEFVFSKDSLQTIKGRHIAGIEPVEGSAEISSAATALLGFLAEVKREEAGCTNILSIEAGYQHRVASTFGEGVLAPVWRITTDTRRYIIDG